ncbi:MAG: carbohydrate ABC transporter permease [Lachnospiraceae bacterium]|nr:carbohydrate ABC transporter permease [Lachnospiraceae bacterium]
MRKKDGIVVKKKKLSTADKVFYTITYTVFILLALVCIYPFYYLIINTISRNDYVDLGLVMYKPIGFHLKNYVNLFKLENVANSLFISVSRTVLGTFLPLITTAVLAYLFTKEHMKHRKFLYRMTVITMYFSAGMIPIYMNIKMLGLLNNFWVYVIPGLIRVYNMVLVKTFIESLPAALEESAQIDGAGYAQRFIHIIFPLSKPILATVALFSAVSSWNSYMDTLLYITDSHLYTLQFTLYEYLNQATAIAASINSMTDMSMLDKATQISTTSVRNTMAVVTILPIICVYPFIQRYYVQGVMIGAVKG